MELLLHVVEVEQRLRSVFKNEVLQVGESKSAVKGISVVMAYLSPVGKLTLEDLRLLL